MLVIKNFPVNLYIVTVVNDMLHDHLNVCACITNFISQELSVYVMCVI